MIGLTEKEILFQLMTLGINSISERSSCYKEYREYSEKTTNEHFGYVFQKKGINLKRTLQRMPANIKISYIHQHLGFRKNLYNGTIKNLSEKGMFISINNEFPPNSKIELVIPVKETFLGISIKKQYIYIPFNIISIVWKGALSNDSCDGIGIELSNPPQCYLDFVGSLNLFSKD